MTDGYTLTDWNLDEHGIAEVTVTKGQHSQRVRVQMATGDETGSDELSTRALAIAAFENLEAERRQREEAAQRRAQRADP